VRREAAREYLAGALWALPSLAVILALMAGSVLSLIQIGPGSPFSGLLFQGTSDDARTLLIGIASTMVTVIALVLGLTLVALQLASTQFSPRLLRNFLRDLTNQLTLSTFVATFAYSTAGLYTVGISKGRRTDDYPRLAVSGALLLFFLSMVMLVYFVHHLAHSIQVDQVMLGVETGTLDVIRHSMTVGVLDAAAPRPPEGADTIPAPRSGYIQTIHPQGLVAALDKHDLTALVVPMMGEHVVARAPLLWVWRTGVPEPASGRSAALDPGALHDVTRATSTSVRIGYERTLEQDVAFGIRQLADVASKALSPAINDPYTAVQAVDHLSVILAELAGREVGPQHVNGGHGTARLHLPGRDFDYMFDLALGQVRRYGASEPRVTRALLRVCNDVSWFCDDGRRAVVRSFVETLLDDVERLIAQPVDRDPLLSTGRELIERLDARADRPVIAE
jgi:uncharacterized membrane protein